MKTTKRIAAVIGALLVYVILLYSATEFKGYIVENRFYRTIYLMVGLVVGWAVWIGNSFYGKMLLPHQEEALNKLKEMKQGSVRVPKGLGKSIIQQK